MTYLKAGTRLEKSPDSGYIVTRDIDYGDPLTPSQFEAYGDVDPVVGGSPVPGWFHNAITKAGVSVNWWGKP